MPPDPAEAPHEPDEQRESSAQDAPAAQEHAEGPVHRVVDGRHLFAPGNPHAFRKGQSGNPKGYTKTERAAKFDLAALIRGELAKVAEWDPLGRTYEELLASAIVKGSMKQAANGGRADILRTLLEYTIGKVPLPIKAIANEDGESLSELRVVVVDEEAERARREGRELPPGPVAEEPTP
jgi:hypothetical protein